MWLSAPGPGAHLETTRSQAGLLTYGGGDGNPSSGHIRPHLLARSEALTRPWAGNGYCGRYSDYSGGSAVDFHHASLFIPQRGNLQSCTYSHVNGQILYHG